MDETIQALMRYNIVAQSNEMLGISKLIQRVAPTDASILITGESGTGKELVARAIHAESLRKEMPFIPLNCAALPETLLESELFGYENGAFTGARGKKPGKFELAHQGTLLLDEIGDMLASTQVKILRVLEEKVVERLGSTKQTAVDVRLIASTNKNLLDLISKNHFREDLYFRLAVFPIHIPPLRERREDIQILARHFMKRFAGKYGKDTIQDFQPAVWEVFSRYGWPGNVRELRNLVERLVILADGPLIEVESLPLGFSSLIEVQGKGCYWKENEHPEERFLPTNKDQEKSDGVRLFSESSGVQSKSILKTSRSDAERQAIHHALSQSSGNRTRAAELLGISRRTLQLKIKKLNISTSDHMLGQVRK